MGEKNLKNPSQGSRNNFNYFRPRLPARRRENSRRAGPQTPGTPFLLALHPLTASLRYVLALARHFQSHPLGGTPAAATLDPSFSRMLRTQIGLATVTGFSHRGPSKPVTDRRSVRSV